MIHNTVKKNAYFDSVTLMLISSKLTELEGIEEAAVMMGTQHNKELMKNSGVLSEEVSKTASENDLIIGVKAFSQEGIDAALLEIEAQFNKKINSNSSAKLQVRTIAQATETVPDLNFSIVSIPGRYAANEVSKLLDHNINVLLFSDNITIEEEIYLKDKAVEKGLLMMGPDCGTAIINGVALGFANVVRRGNIGLVAASGTGLQEVTVIIDKLGGGVSQALGTGGRDLKQEIGGRMMRLALDLLEKDSKTEVIGIISKPPSKEVIALILDQIKTFSKPVVVCFLGGDKATFNETKAVYAANLEELAHRVVLISNGKQMEESINLELTLNQLSAISKFKQQLNPQQKYLRALYTGGTLAYESLLILGEEIGQIHSNLAKDKKDLLIDVNNSEAHTIVDMGDDYFTDGMPHPMIDPRLRSERILREAKDPETAVILLDCVLGFGSHANPAKALASAVAQAKALNKNNHIVYIASVCGTEKDPQVLSNQVEQLEKVGIYVVDTNAQAAKMAAEILKRG
jgi:FdrA protein